MKRILLHLDADPHPSAFDRVVALDAGADEVMSYGGVTPKSAVPLAHGAIFTRGPADLRNTAVFVGGSDADAAAAVAEAVTGAFFGPLRVSVLIDPGGANTTAAAAVAKLGRVVPWGGAAAAVLGCGAVGSRVARLLARGGAAVRLFDPDDDRAERVAAAVQELDTHADLRVAAADAAVDGAAAVFACGPAGVEVASLDELAAAGARAVADLNAVPPAGVDGVDPHDDGRDRRGVRCFGPLAVGGLKMSAHKAAVRSLFEANDRVLHAADLLDLAEKALDGGGEA